MGLLDGTTGIVFGVANKRSIAWAIARALAGAGMRLAFTYQGDRLKENVEELAGTLPGAVCYPCDVGSDGEGDFVATAREGFRVAHDVSAYSLVGLVRAALPLLEKSDQASVIAMTYLGSERVAAGYNVMGVAKASLEASVRYLAANLGPKGIRVNAISAGPVNTLAARGIRGFTDMLKHYAEKAPLRRNVELREVGDAALFLASRMASGITGEVIYVDCGYNIMAV